MRAPARRVWPTALGNCRMLKLVPCLLCSSVLLTACATTSEVSPAETITQTVYIEREIDRSLFEDHGVPEVGGLNINDHNETDAATQVMQLGAALKDYRCRLNAAGRALIADFPPIPGCVEPAQ